MDTLYMYIDKSEQKLFKIQKNIYMKSHLCDITSILALMLTVQIGKQCLLSWMLVFLLVYGSPQIHLCRSL